MSKRNQAENLHQEIDARQRNLVYPDTLSNEVRFWRNLDNRRLTTPQKIGLALLVLLFGRFLATLLRTEIQEGLVWRDGLAIVAFWGPLFAALAWGTRRALREATEAKKRKKGPHH
jgi:hypothetical protein